VFGIFQLGNFEDSTVKRRSRISIGDHTTSSFPHSRTTRALTPPCYSCFCLGPCSHRLLLAPLLLCTLLVPIPFKCLLFTLVIAGLHSLPVVLVGSPA